MTHAGRRRSRRSDDGKRSAHSQGSEIECSNPRGLTPHDRPVLLADNVRALFDWLVDEELKRWQREDQ